MLYFHASFPSYKFNKTSFLPKNQPVIVIKYEYQRKTGLSLCFAPKPLNYITCVLGTIRSMSGCHLSIGRMSSVCIKKNWTIWAKAASVAD